MTRSDASHEKQDSKPNMPPLLNSSHKTSDKVSLTSIAPLSAIILAGGAGRRMGGLDKGLVHYQGKPLVQWVKEALPATVEQVIISCNRHANEYAQYGQTIFDLPSEFTYGGALSGILAGLVLCRNDWVIIAPCDLIFYPTDFAQSAWTALAQHLQHSPKAAKIAVAHDGERRQNLCLLMHKDETDGLIQALQKSRAVHDWLDAQQALNIPWANAQAFLNINDQTQLKALEKNNSE
jgi:molybdopterin-guanine dinucleotide biosynthesis protein A